MNNYYLTLYAILFILVGAFLHYAINVYHLEVTLDEPLAYYQEGYVCYHAKDLINNMDYKEQHEMAHWSVDNDYEHFCGE